MGNGAAPPRPRATGASPLHREAVLTEDGTVPICLITPGWGSSGYYSAEVLRQAVDAGVFEEGVHMYWDHMTRSEEWDRPERSLRDLAGVLAQDGQWDENGFNGPGVYSVAKVF